MTAQELIPRVKLDEITGSRSIAIGHWMRAYDTFHEASQAAKLACVGGALSLKVPSGHGYEDEKLTHAFMARGLVKEWEGHNRVEIDARAAFEKLITQAVDRRCWSHLMETFGFDRLLDRQAREEFAEGLKTDPPAFTTENCASTFGNIWESRRDIFLRGIANTFSKLDRRFRSHDGFKIGARLIIERAFTDYSSWADYNRRDTLRDVERVLREVDGKGPCAESMSIAAQIENARRSGEPMPFVIHGDYFRVRIFNNGNLHIWFERDELLREVNKLLAEYYGEVIGDGFNETEADDAPEYHLTPAKNHGAFMSNEDVAERLFRHVNLRPGERVLEPSAGTGVLARYARAAGALVTCVEIQPGLAHELRVVHGFENVVNADFLRLPRSLGDFDLVAMNPPFDRGRDCDHVRHAMQLVRPGGALIAIMSARAEFADDKRHAALHREIAKWGALYGRDRWHDLPAGSFAHAGTNVNTVVLAIRRPRS